MSDNLLEDSSSLSSEEEDDDAKELTEDVEKTFFKTLSYIKKKDPKIYDENVKFFSETGESQNENKLKKKKKETPLNLRAYERKLIVERGGELSDEEQEHVEEEGRSQSPTYTEEQRALKDSFKKVLSDDSDNEDTWGGLFHKRDKTDVEEKKEDEGYREWLKGQKDDLADKEAEKDMQFLHDYWTDPKLDKGEQFLRDYILNKRFLEKDDEPEVDMNKLLEEEEELEEQTMFEHKYNYRFEEPDQEFIKRYPRVMANSLRLKDERRKEKREETKERKMKEKEKKKEEIVKKKKLKKQEIEEKLEELRKLTGNDQLAFENHLNTDFDEDEYDRTMKRLFNEEFYLRDDPNFDPKNMDCEEYEGGGGDFIYNEDNDANFNCEDPNFIMDCDYDPTKVSKKDQNEGKGRRARDKHRRTTVSEAVNREKPVFDPEQHCSFQDYIDQYYGIDCEDFIGDQPCRFKYKRVIPNNYGLTVEEILAADDKELERWCSMKRVHKVGSQHKERNDAKMYSKKAKDDNLKMKILPSLYSVNSKQDKSESTGEMKKKKKKKLKVTSDTIQEEENYKETTVTIGNEIDKKLSNVREADQGKSKLPDVASGLDKVTDGRMKKVKRKLKDKSQTVHQKVNNATETEHISHGDKLVTKKKAKKRKVQHESNAKNEIKAAVNTADKTETAGSGDDSAGPAKKKKKHDRNTIDVNINGLDIGKSEGKSRRQRKNEKAKLVKTKKKENHKYPETFKMSDKYEKKLRNKNVFSLKKNDNKVAISDSRLKAYGIKPKVFKDKLKYGTKFTKFADSSFTF